MLQFSNIQQLTFIIHQDKFYMEFGSLDGGENTEYDGISWVGICKWISTGGSFYLKHNNLTELSTMSCVFLKRGTRLQPNSWSVQGLYSRHILFLFLVCCGNQTEDSSHLTSVWAGMVTLIWVNPSLNCHALCQQGDQINVALMHAWLWLVVGQWLLRRSTKNMCLVIKHQPTPSKW